MNIFSIVIPVHNKESYLKKTLNCILNQTYTHFELILVNDGSKDLSGNICDKYAASDSRIKVIHQKMEVFLMRGTMELKPLQMN